MLHRMSGKLPSLPLLHSYTCRFTRPLWRTVHTAVWYLAVSKQAPLSFLVFLHGNKLGQGFLFIYFFWNLTFVQPIFLWRYRKTLNLEGQPVLGAATRMNESCSDCMFFYCYFERLGLTLVWVSGDTRLVLREKVLCNIEGAASNQLCCDRMLHLTWRLFNALGKSWMAHMNVADVFTVHGATVLSFCSGSSNILQAVFRGEKKKDVL